MSKFGYHIHRRPTKFKGEALYLYAKINRKQERHLLGHDLNEEEAKAAALKKLASISDKVTQRVVTIPVSTAFTLGDAVALYRKVSANKEVGSAKQQESRARQHFYPFFGENKPLADFSAEDGLSYLVHRKPKVKQATISGEWRFLMRLMNLAVDYEKIPRNRLRVIEVDYGAPRKRIVTMDELEAIQAVAVPELFRLIMVACNVGLRESMLFNIQDTWVSPREDGWWLLLPEPKTKIKRHPPKIPLNRVALAGLFPDGLNIPQGRIFTRWAFTNGLRRAWTSTCRKAGIEDLHIHDLRHTFATWLQEVGTDYEVRQVLLGHRMPGTTEQYSHGGKAFDAKVRKAVDELAATYDLCKLTCKSRAKVFDGLSSEA